MTVTRVNFKNPKTGNYQNGWGVLINNVWTIKTYSDKIFNIDSINSKFESLKC